MQNAPQTTSAHRLLKRRALGSLTLATAVFCCVSGGPFGLEALVGNSGSGLALLMIALVPLFWALPDALTTAELAAALPKEGGYVVWVKRALGPFWGFLNGWWTWMYTLVDVAIYPVLFTTYLGAMLKLYFGWSVLESDGPVAFSLLAWSPTTGELLRWGVCVAIVAVFTFLNVRGTRVVGLTGFGFAALIIVPFVILGVVGGFQLALQPREIVHEFVPKDQTVMQALASGLGIVMWNYLGWDQLSTVAEEVDDPGRAYPRAMLIGVPLITLIYLIPTAVGLAFFPDSSKWVDGAWPEIAQAVGGPWLGVLITVAGLVSPMALFMASMLASSRVPFVLAEDGFLPKSLMEIHPTWGTPWKAILLQGGVNALLTYKTFQELVAVNVVMYGAALALEQTSLGVLRRKEPDLPRPFRIPGGWPVIALIVLLPVGMVGLLVTVSIQEEGWEKQWLTGALLVSAPVIYGVKKVLGQRSTTNRP